MFVLDTVSPENATGAVEKIYKTFPPEIGIPLPLQLMSASPGFLACQFEFIKYYGGHAKLSFPLLAAIRYMAASDCDYDYCVRFNRKILMASGASEQEVDAITGDMETVPFEENEKALLKFVAKAVKTPAAVEAEDVKALHRIGWKDADILDAVAHGAYMRGHGTLMRVFQKG